MSRSLKSYLQIAISAILVGAVAIAIGCGGGTATATSVPSNPTATTVGQATATATSQPVGSVPAPKNPVGTITLGRPTLDPLPGIHTVYGNQYQLNAWGVGEDLFTWENQGGTTKYDVGVVAKSWDLASDLSSVTVEIRTGVQFHNGYGEMTAEDVAWAYNQVNPSITSQSIAPSASYFTALLGDNEAVVVDSTHVKFTFNKFVSNWNTYMMNMQGFVGLNVTSKKAFDEKGETWAKDNFIGTGPFKVDSWARDDNAVFSKTGNHWKYNPKIDKVVIRAIPESATMIAAVKTGEIDAAEVGLKDVTALKASGFDSYSTGDITTSSVIFSGNLWEATNAATGEDLATAKSPVYINPIPWIGNPYNDGWGSPPSGMTSMDRAKLVRTAVALGIDRESIAKNILGGLGWPIFINYLDSKNPNSKAEWNYPYDPARANQLLDDAGYKKGSGGSRFEMPLFVQSGLYSGLGAEMGDAISGMMARIGITTEIQKYPYAIYRPGLVARTATIPRLQNGDDGRGIFPFDWPKGIEASSLSRGGYCICFETPFMTDTYLEVATEPDENKRIGLNTEMFQQLFDWALMPGVVAIPQATVVNPKSVKSWDFQPTPFGTNAFWALEPAR